MRGPWLSLLLALPFPGLAIAQDDVGAWIVSLHDDRRRLTALSRLHEMGVKVLPSLLQDFAQSVEQKDTAAAAHTLLAITRFGAEAAPISKELCAGLADAPTGLQVPLLRAIGAIGPAALLVEPDAVEMVRRTATPVGRTRQEWNLTLARLELVDGGMEQKRGMLAGKTLVPACAVSMWIVDDPRRAVGLEEALRSANRTAVDFRQQQGESWQLMVEETALALARSDPDTGWREKAWGQLLHYFDPAVRVEAAASLRRDPGGATSSVPALIEALADPERAVVREAMLTLSFFSDEAIAALPPLSDLQSSTDRELRSIATAACRGIRSNLTSIPAIVAELLDGGAVDAEAVVQRIAATGPRAKVHVEAMSTTAKGAIKLRVDAALAALNR